MHKLRDYLPPFLLKSRTCAAAIGHGISPRSPSQSAAKDQIQQHKRLCSWMCGWIFRKTTSYIIIQLLYCQLYTIITSVKKNAKIQQHKSFCAVGFCLFYFLRFAVFLTVFLDL